MDHSITVAPGSEFPVQAAGDFVFCKFADRDIRVIIQNSPRTMRAGSKWRPAGGFEAGDVIVQNPDPVNPVAVVLTIGVGDFDDQIIHGDVSVTPVLRGADGQARPDSRRTISLDLAPQYESGADYVPGSIRKTVSGDYGDRWVSMNGRYFSFSADPLVGGSMALWERDVKTLEVVGRSPAFTSVSGTPFTNTAPNMVAGGIDGFLYGIWWNDILARIDPLTGVVTPLFNASRSDGRGHTGVIVDYPFVMVAADVELLEVWDLRTGERVADEYLPVGVRSIKTGYKSGPFEFQVYDSSSSDVYTVERRAGGTWEQIDVRGLATAGPPNVTSGGVVPALGVESIVIPTGSDITKRATRSFTVPASGLAVIAGCGNLFNRLAKRRGLENVNETRAAVTVDWLDRRAVARGEIIRLIIEWYTGELAPDDYLDHVYSARLFKPTGTGAEKAVNTGARTFAAAGVADDFEVYMPCRVELTVDNELATSPLF